MARGWHVSLVKPTEIITSAVQRAWGDSLDDLEKWMSSDLVVAMVDGGLGIDGIASTPFYRFISSPDGLSQLGIEKTEPPKLLNAYKRSFKVSRNRKLIVLKFGDTARLKIGTPHAAAGTGNLNVASWMEWILDGVNVGSGFVPRGKLPAKAQKSIRVKSSPGGLMLPRGAFGSIGMWRFPSALQNYDRKWLEANIGKIQKAIIDQMTMFLTRRLS